MSASQSIPVGTLPAAVASAAAEQAGASMTHAPEEAASQERASQTRLLLERVWNEEAGSLSSLAVGLGLSREQAADVLQDVFVTALRRLPAALSDADAAKWLMRVTINRCHLEHRRRGRWRRLWQSLSGTWQAETPAARVNIGQLRREVGAALACLTDDDRLLVVLRYFVNRNSREIAEIVEQPESTVRGRLRAARQQLAELLADWKD